jgi:hypothetical protein
MPIDSDNGPVVPIPGQLTLFDPDGYVVVEVVPPADKVVAVFSEQLTLFDPDGYVVVEVVPPADKIVAVFSEQLTLFDPNDYVIPAEVVSLGAESDGACSPALKVAA